MASGSSAWFEWVHYHRKEAECPCDCIARTAAFAAGRRLGRQEGFNLSVEFAGLEPQIARLLEELVMLREERAVERDILESDMRPAF